MTQASKGAWKGSSPSWATPSRPELTSFTSCASDGRQRRVAEVSSGASAGAELLRMLKGNDFDGTAAARAAPVPPAQRHDQGYNEYDSNWSWQGWQGWQGWQDWQDWREWTEWVAERPWDFDSERHSLGYEPRRPPERSSGRDYDAFGFDEAQPEFTSLADIANRTKLFAETSKQSEMQDARSWPASTSLMPVPRHSSYENAFSGVGFAEQCQSTWEEKCPGMPSTTMVLPAQEGQQSVRLLPTDGSTVPAMPAGESLPSNSGLDPRAYSRGFSKWFGPNAVSPPESAFITSTGVHEAGFSTDAGSGVESSEEEVQK
ncbi:unnamed protein product [Symbiodinium sp. CCMP2592]|nr:unnamed protein product [Symbiodinium sp. CCMP2592]